MGYFCALDNTNKFLQINFDQKVSKLAPSDIKIQDAKNGDLFGVKAVTLAADGKSAQLELFENTESKNVLQENREYTVTVTVNGKTTSGTFYDAAFTEARITDIDVEKKEFKVVDNKLGTPKTIKVVGDVTFDFQGAIGELARVWYNDDNELIKAEIVSANTVLEAVEITDKDEIKVLSTGKKYDLSEETYVDAAGNPVAKKKFKLYINGETIAEDEASQTAIETAVAQLKDKKINFAKVGFDKSGDIEYISAYTLNDVLITDRVEGNDIVGVEGEGTGGSFNAKDATVVKDGKVIALSEVKKGDIVFFNKNADNKDGYAIVYNKSVTGPIETVYSDAIKVNGKNYKFLNGGAVTDFTFDLTGYTKSDFNYSTAVFINEDGKTELLDDTDKAEELQAAGDVTVYVDPAGNLVYVAGKTASINKNEVAAVLTDSIDADTNFNKTSIQLQAVLPDGKEVTKQVALSSLDKVYIDGQEYKLKDDDTDATDKDYVVEVVGTNLLVFNTDAARDAYVTAATDSPDVLTPDASTVVKSISLTPAEGRLVKLKLDDNGAVTQLELYSGIGTPVEGSDTFTYVSGTNQVVEAGDNYIEGKKLLSSTVVYDATDVTGSDYDVDDITTTTWGAYKGSDITSAKFIYNDNNEVVALVIDATTTNDTTFEGAVVTKVLKNVDGEIVEINAYVDGSIKTYKVDEVNKSLSKGQAVVLELDDNDLTLVKNFVVEDGNYVAKDKIVKSVDVSKREVTFTDDTKYKLVSGGAVLDGSDVDDITVEALSDLTDANIKVTVITDEKGLTTPFAKFFVFSPVAAGTYESTITTADAAALNVTYDGLAGSIALPTTGANGSVITWAETTDASNVATPGTNAVTITRDALNDVDDSITYTATITKGATSTTKAFIWTVKEAKAPATATASAKTIAAAAGTITVTLDEAINATSQTAVQDAIKAKVAGVAATDLGFSWNAYNKTLTITNNHATIPATFSADATVSVTDLVGNTNAALALDIN